MRVFNQQIHRMLFMVSLAIVFLALPVLAQSAKQDPTLPPYARVPAKTAEPAPTAELNQAIERLSKQLSKLADQINRITRHEDLLLDLFQLQLEESRVERLEDRVDALAKKLKDVQDTKAQIQYRMNNAGVEVTMRGALRRDVAERELRDALTKELRAVQQQEDEAQGKLSAAEAELDQARRSLAELKARIEELRGKVAEETGKDQ